MKPVTALAASLFGAMPVMASAPAPVPVFDTIAPVAFMIDLSSGAELFAKNADRRMPPASMAKVMTTYVAFRLIDQGKIKLSQSFPVRPEVWKQWHGAGSTMFLRAGEQVSIDNLLHGIVTLSANDACIVLAEGVAGSEAGFVARMNAEAKALGLKNSHFATANGWPDGGRTYTTARDLATLSRAVLDRYPALYRQFFGQPSFSWGKTNRGGKPISQPNRNPILGRIKGADGIKTGHTSEAGYGFIGSAAQNGRRLVMVLAGLDSEAARVKESVRFMEWGFGAWRAAPLVAPGKKLGEAKVQNGWSGSVGLVAPKALAFTHPAGVKAVPTISIRYVGPLMAPVKKGQHVADLSVKSDGLAAQVMPLVASESVAEAGFFGRAWAGLGTLI